MKVAVVGTGIAGMACAAKLQSSFDLSVFERDAKVGGHTNTIEVDEGGQSVWIDTGFMVYNEVTYPRLTQLFSDLGIVTEPTVMSFSVQHLPSGLEFAGTGWNGLFSQRSNFLKLRHWKLLWEINRFNRLCKEVLSDETYGGLTVRDYCDKRKFSQDFVQHYLLPMSSAVWSSSQRVMLEFPIFTLVRFFANHRFLSLHGQLSWRTVVGGSRCYRDRLVHPFRHTIRTGVQIQSVSQSGESVLVKPIGGAPERFDVVVMACHADQALRALESPSELQSRLLGVWAYQKNTASLHVDERVMPRSKRAWTSWNYRIGETGASTIYWMNNLQRVSKKRNYFVSINGTDMIDSSQIIFQTEYEHPLYSLAALRTQAELPSLNEVGRILFCGSYFKYGFHEDALCAGQDAADAVLRRFA